jgi:maleylpyruvate isomerase
VLTHLARNADGGRRLLGWARTGVEAYEYQSLDKRAEEIESGAGRPVDELVADLRDSAERFAAEYRLMEPAAWSRVVRWTTGQERPAARIADARLTEVLVHHVDLDAGYLPEHWPADFVHDMLDRVVASFNKRAEAPALQLQATDSSSRYDVGTAPTTPLIRGTSTSLLAWLMGRSPGQDLTPNPVPTPPALY